MPYPGPSTAFPAIAKSRKWRKELYSVAETAKIVVITTKLEMVQMSSSFSLKSPVRPAQRGPLASQVQRQLKLREELFYDPLLPLRDVQVALGGVSYAHIRKLIADGTLKVFRIGRGHMKVRASVLKKLLQDGDRQLRSEESL